jgi:thioesterase domain-containing protein
MAARWDSRRAARVVRSAGPAQPIDVDVDSPDTAADVDRFAAQITGTSARLLVVRALDPDRPSWTAHLGWAGLSEHLVARNVRATHLGLLREPQVREVAHAIVQMLDSGGGPSEERSAVEL